MTRSSSSGPKMRNSRGVVGDIIVLAVSFLLILNLHQTDCAPALDEEDVDGGGCYYMFNHYGEGDRIFTNEPCLNCTCHNSMLMCYLRVCPFTKPIGQDCTIEKKPDQCCPVINCPEVPVSLVTPSTLLPSSPTTTTAASTSTSLAPIEGSTELAPYERGCNIEGKFYPDGAQLEGDPSKPCELCYCIRNRTACVMQECILHVEGCEPVFQPGVCCPVRYRCDYPPQLSDESTTTVAGLISTTLQSIFTTSPAPVGGCVRDGEYYADGSQIPGATGPCEHCYCMRGEIVCAVQECGAPLENVGGNCTAIPPPPGMCCPEKYTCEGDKRDEEVQTTTVESVTAPVQDETRSSTSAPESTEGPVQSISESETGVTSAPQDDVEKEAGTTSAPKESSSSVGSDDETTEVGEPSVTSHPQEEVSGSTSKPEDSVHHDESSVTEGAKEEESHTTEIPITGIQEGTPDQEQKVSQEPTTQGPSVIEIDDAAGFTTTTEKSHETSSEKDNLITSSTENVLVVSTAPAAHPESEASTEENPVTSTETPEGVTSSSSPSSPSSVESDEESSSKPSSESVESSTESSTEKQPHISGVDQDPSHIMMIDDETSTSSSALESSSEPSHETGIKDQQSMMDEDESKEATSKPMDEAEVGVTTVQPEHPSKKPVDESKEEKEAEVTTTAPVHDEKVKEEATSKPVAEMDEDKKSDSAEVTTTSPVHPVSEESSTEVVPTQKPVKVESSTAGPSEGHMGEGEVVGEMHVSSTPEPAESLSMHSTSTTTHAPLPAEPEDENEVEDGKVAAQDKESHDAVTEIATQQPSIPSEGEEVGQKDVPTQPPIPVTTETSSSKETDSEVTTVIPPKETKPVIGADNVVLPVDQETGTEGTVHDGEDSIPDSDVKEGEHIKTVAEVTTTAPAGESDAEVHSTVAPSSMISEEGTVTEKVSSEDIPATTQAPAFSEPTAQDDTKSTADEDKPSEPQDNVPVTTTQSTPVKDEEKEHPSEVQTTEHSLSETEEEQSGPTTVQTPSVSSVDPEQKIGGSQLEGEGKLETGGEIESTTQQTSSSTGADVEPEQGTTSHAVLEDTKDEQTTVAPAAEKEGMISEAPTVAPEEKEAVTTAAPSTAQDEKEEVTSASPVPTQEKEEVTTASPVPAQEEKEEVTSVSPAQAPEEKDVVTTMSPGLAPEDMKEEVTTVGPIAALDEKEEEPMPQDQAGEVEEIPTTQKTPEIDESEHTTLPPPQTDKLPPAQSQEKDDEISESVKEKEPEVTTTAPLFEDSAPSQDEQQPSVDQGQSQQDETPTTSQPAKESLPVTTAAPVSEDVGVTTVASDQPAEGAAVTTVSPMTELTEDEEKKHDAAEPTTAAPEHISSHETVTSVPTVAPSSGEADAEPGTTFSPPKEEKVHLGPTDTVHLVDDVEITTQKTSQVEEQGTDKPMADDEKAPEKEQVDVTTVPSTGEGQEGTTSHPGDVSTSSVSPVKETSSETVTELGPETTVKPLDDEGVQTTVPSIVGVEHETSSVTTPSVEEDAAPTSKPIHETKPEMEDLGATVQPPSVPETFDMTMSSESPGSVESDDDDSRVPGEGYCFVEGKTYKNGSSIPPTTPCHIVCACQNSIVHCLLVHCNPPPSDTGDCKPIYKQGVCCPSYDCEDAQDAPVVTVTPGPVPVNDSNIVTVTPESVSSVETTSADTSSASVGDEPGVSPSTESGESSSASSEEPEKTTEAPKPDHDDSSASHDEEDAVVDHHQMNVTTPPSSLVSFGPGDEEDHSPQIPVSSSPGPESPIASEEDKLDQENGTLSELPGPQTPGSLYPVTTTTTVTPSSAPWPYPTSTPSPSVMSTGACLFDGRVFMSAQQIPRDDPCDFCFCFRGDIICLQQSCPPPIPGCYEEPIPGFCCPRYECPVGNGNGTTQPPSNFPPSYYHNQILNGMVSGGQPGPGAVANVPSGPGCEVQGEYYESGQIITSTSGPCLECRCGSTGMMECDPRECQPEPMLRKMIAAITSR